MYVYIGLPREHDCQKLRANTQRVTLAEDVWRHGIQFFLRQLFGAFKAEKPQRS